MQAAIAPIRRVAPAELASPWPGARFVEEDHYLLEEPIGPFGGSPPAFELAGPRRHVAFGPHARAAILTAGGLSPGLNDVVRGLTLTLWHGYGLRTILGIRHGFAGLGGPDAPDVLPLTPDAVIDVHREGGTFLGTSRGAHDVSRAADIVERLGLHALFCVGGDGTLKGALALDRELEARGRAASIVGIPKPIDNDVLHCSRTFGFTTAVEQATHAIDAAHAEARAHEAGIAVVQLMGRESGFIAAAASLACPDVNICLVPEARFEIGGPHGLVAAVEKRLRDRGHCVIVVAEGAGADLWSEADLRRDASGNVKLPAIGPRIEQELKEGLAARGLEPTVKVIDPSYMIRSVIADPDDRILCIRLAQAAAHAAMSGRSRLMVGLVGDHFAHVQLEAACAGRKKLDVSGELWQAVLASTGQPPLVAPAP